MKIEFRKSYSSICMLCLWMQYVNSVPVKRRRDTSTQTLGDREREQSRTNGGVGNTYAPVNTEEEPNMFTIPRLLNSGDRFVINGTLKANPQKFTIALTSGDRDYIPCIVNFDFSSVITLEKIYNGVRDSIDSNGLNTQSYFNDATTFEVEFYYSDRDLTLMIDQSHVHSFSLEPSVEFVKYIQVSGDVEKVKKLSFHYA